MAKIKTEYGYKSVWSNGIHFITTTKVKDTTLMDQLLLAQMGIKRTTLMESVTEKMVRLMNTQVVLKSTTLMENMYGKNKN